MKIHKLLSLLLVSLILSGFGIFGLVIAQEATISPTIPIEITETPTLPLEPSPIPEEQQPTTLSTPTLEPSPTIPIEITDTPTPTLPLAQTPTPTVISEVLPTPETTTPAGPTTTSEVVPQSNLVVEQITTTTEPISLATTIPTDSGSTDNNNEVVVLTGDATVYANLVNMVNTNVIDSNVKVFFITLDEGTTGDIDINALWNEILAAGNQNGFVIEQTTYQQTQLISSSNTANASNQVSLDANTGTNTVDGGNEVTMITGNAVGVANVINYINTSWIASNYLMGVININGYSGNIILPRFEYFTTQPAEQAYLLQINNQAQVINNINATTTTGNNTIDNSGVSSNITTGNANSLVNSQDVINLSAVNFNQFMMTVNNGGNWDGQVNNLNGAGNNGIMSNAISSLYYSYLTEAIASGQIFLDTNNQAIVNNQIYINANTGGNQITGNGNASINSGNATAIANLYNFINLQLLSSNWLYSLVNITGDWKGKFIFAYPDLAVDLSTVQESEIPGSEVLLTVHYTNKGYDKANNSVISLTLPNGVEYLSDSSGLPIVHNGNSVSWNLGELVKDRSGAFTIRTHIDENIFEANSSNSGIVKSAHAVDSQSEKDLNSSVQINSNDPDSDLSNNSDSSIIRVTENIEWISTNNLNVETGDSIDHRQPVIEVNSKNNVGAFVYPIDIVSFETLIKNKSDSGLYSAKLIHKVYDPQSNLISTSNLPLGTISAFKEGTLRFGINLGNIFLTTQAKSGRYTTVSQIVGLAADGSQVVSNESITEFNVKVVTPFLTNTNEVGTVLAANTITPVKQVNLFPYLLLFVSSAGWIMVTTRRMLAMHLYNVRSFVMLGMALILFGYSFITILSINKHKPYIINPVINLQAIGWKEYKIAI